MIKNIQTVPQPKTGTLQMPLNFMKFDLVYFQIILIAQRVKTYASSNS